ncbi:MAG: glycosyltransferase family 4 protein [bacterium]|nr:glycosyltransferase family 4 protein [bacterium]
MRKMRVLFLTQTAELGAASRYLVYQYLRFLEQEGIECTVSPGIPSKHFSKAYFTESLLKKIPYHGLVFLKRLRELSSLNGYDIIFVQKCVLPQTFPVIETIISHLNKKLIFDIDESLFYLPPRRKRSTLYRLRYNAIPRILKMSRHVIAGNNYLRDYILNYNSNVSVIPTVIDTDRYAVRDYKNDNNKNIVIGWMGNPTTSIYLDQLRTVFKVLSQRYNITIRIIGANGFKIDDVEVDSRDWNLHSEVKELQDFDIGIMPLTDDVWTRGKCGCKILQYMGVGVPAVASRIGENGKIIKDGINGFLADSNDEWIEKLSLLIEDPTLRQKMGKEGRNTVENFYSLKVNTSKLKAVLEKVYLSS